MAEGIHCRRHLRGSANRDADAVDARTKARRHSARSIARRFFGLRCELPFCDCRSRQPTWTVPLRLGVRVPGHGRTSRVDRSFRIGLVHSASAFRTIRGGISNIRCLMSYATPSDAKLPGGVATTPDNANDMIVRGYRALVLGFDWSLLRRGIAFAIQGIGIKDSACS